MAVIIKIIFYSVLHICFHGSIEIDPLTDRLVEGMRELTAIQDQQEVCLCCPLLLIHAHRKCKTVDRDAIQQLDATVKKIRTNANEKVESQSGVIVDTIIYWIRGHIASIK